MRGYHDGPCDDIAMCSSCAEKERRGINTFGDKDELVACPKCGQIAIECEECGALRCPSHDCENCATESSH